MTNEVEKEVPFSLHETCKDFISAAIGSICCCYTGQPFDTIKVRMQNTTSIGGIGIGTGVGYQQAVPKSSFEILQYTIRQESIQALWKGSIPTALGMIAENIVAFGINEQVKRIFKYLDIIPPDAKTDPIKSTITSFTIGAGTGCISALVLIPSEVVKAKTQIETGNIGSNIIYQKILKQRGISGLFIGLDGQIVRDMLFYSAFFGSYDLICLTINNMVPQCPEQLTFFLSGGFAGMLGWSFTMPADVPKTVVQGSWETKVIGSYIPTMKMILKERGILGLYSGIGPCLIRAFPANAALFLGVETTKKYFDIVFPK